MPVLLAALLGSFASVAHAADCANAASPAQLSAALDKAETAWKSADEDGFLLRMEEAHLQLPCLSAAIEPALAARYHRDAGLWLFVSGQKEQAQQAFGSARRIEADHALPPDMLPAKHPIRVVFQSSAPDPASAGVDAAADGRVLFDGAEGDRPTAGPTIAQLEKTAGGVAWSQYLRPADTLPEYAIATRKPKAVAKPKVDKKVDKKDNESHALRWGLVAGAGALAVGGGAMGLVARNTQTEFVEEEQANKAEADALFQKNHTASTTSALLLSAAGAVGIGAVFAW